MLSGSTAIRISCPPDNGMSSASFRETIGPVASAGMTHRADPYPVANQASGVPKRLFPGDVCAWTAENSSSGCRMEPVICAEIRRCHLLRYRLVIGP